VKGALARGTKGTGSLLLGEKGFAREKSILEKKEK